MLWLIGALLAVGSLLWLTRRHRGSQVKSPSPLPEPSVSTLPAFVEVSDELDLHGVPPHDVDELVDAFIDVASERGWRWVRIVHGKGIGVRRQQVRTRLARHSRVLTFADASPPSHWGATIVELKPITPDIACRPRSD